jgi:adenylate cyclase
MTAAAVPSAAGGPSGRALARRLQLWLTLAIVQANIVGACVVFIVAVLVVPESDVPTGDTIRLVNGLLAAVYVAVAVPIGVIWGTRRMGEVRRWLAEDRSPTEREQKLVLRAGLRLFSVQATLWLAAALVFGIFNSTYSLKLGVRVGITVAMAGTTTSAVAYLLTERIARRAAARALAAGAPPRLVGPGVTLRALFAWALGTGIPVLGVVLVGIDVLAGEDPTRAELAVTMVGLGGIALVIGLLSTLVAARATADPINSVRRALHEVEEGNLDVEVAVYDGTQIGLLQAGFNRMVAGLRERERIRDLFGRQVGEDVAREALEPGEVELGGQEVDVAVLFVDLIGSTTLATERPPEEVVDLLNRFFDVVIHVVEQEGGWINKFEGDAALAIFGAPVELEDRDSKALAAARKLGERLGREVPELEAGIGVSGGTAVAGNIGAARRFEYTVIGDPVNEAARLTELAKSVPARVLANADLVDRADASEADRWEGCGEETLRGRSEPTRLATPRRDG